MTVSAALEVLLGVAALIVVAAGALGYYRSNRDRLTITSLETQNRAFETRIVWLEGEAKRQTEQIRTLTAENETLKNIVTGIDFLKRISQDMAMFNEQRRVEHDQIITSLGSVHDLALELLKRSA